MKKASKRKRNFQDDTIDAPLMAYKPMTSKELEEVVKTILARKAEIAKEREAKPPKG